MSNGAYCGYTPNFYKEYNLEEKGVSMTGREVLMQALREKCLHKIMSENYKDEGDLFWTFFGYLGKCFVESEAVGGTSAKSFDECYDWSTVLIQGNEEIDKLLKCVDGSFTKKKDLESDNKILRADKAWADSNHIKLHPSVTINNITYTGESLSGREMEIAICEENS